VIEMPIYQYRCQECDKSFERFVPVWRKAAAPACPDCGAAKAERILAPFAAKVGRGVCGAPTPGSR
jgi:putative FmdB family regulatory protein